MRTFVTTDGIHETGILTTEIIPDRIDWIGIMTYKIHYSVSHRWRRGTNIEKIIKHLYVLVFQLEVYHVVVGLLAGLTALQKGPTALAYQQNSCQS